MQLDLEPMGAPASLPAKSNAAKLAGRDAGAPRAARFTGATREHRPVSSRPRPSSLDPSPSTPFDKLPVALQRRGIQLQLIGLNVSAGYELVEALRLAAERPVAVAVQEVASSPTAKRCVFRDRTGLVHLIPEQAARFEANSLALNLSAGTGKISHDGVQIRWRLAKRREHQLPKRRPGCEYFDAERVGSHVLLRHWRPGDRFQPIGMQKAMKLQDFFTNEKVPRPQRHKLIVATAESGEVFWVEGLRISERFKLTEQTGRSLQWGWQRL